MQVLVFGGRRLSHPQFTYFTSALTGLILHGHPDDEAAIVTQDEQIDLLREVYNQEPPSGFAGLSDVKQQRWRIACIDLMSDERRDHYRTFLGAKVLLAGTGRRQCHADPYVKNEQARIEERDGTVREFLHLV